jgi:hypothetical protein
MVVKKQPGKRAGKAAKEEIKSVPSTPAKSFFVSMLTRDIDLQDAILDLLDNCVDGAIRSRTKKEADEDTLRGYWANIKFGEKKFVIEDNCGGIPWKLAKEYAFCMGRPPDAPTKPGTIGVVGIGMKRAIFKMGRECYVHSNHHADSFLVTIPPEWFRDDDLWEFEAAREPPKTKDYGTIIEVTELEDPVSVAFKSGSSFRLSFPALVGEAYSYLIEKGFTVKVGGEKVVRKPVRLCFESPDNPRATSELIRPYIYRAQVNGVDVFLAVGYRSRLLTQAEQEREAEMSFAAKDAGWTVVCNDRVVLSNDRTTKTGWGFGGVPNFHNQFSCIGGIVEFSSNDTASLPVTTTKRGIDTSNELYTVVRQRMQEGIKHFTRNTNRWKGNESALKERFTRGSFFDLRDLKHLSDGLLFSTVRGDGVHRQYVPKLPEKKTLKTTRRICFVKKVTQIEKVSRYLFDEVREPEEVGEACFDSFMEQANK